MSIQTLPDEDLKKLALDIFAGRVFTDRHLQRLESIQSVFMILAFLNKEQLADLKQEPPGLIYEYL